MPVVTLAGPVDRIFRRVAPDEWLLHDIGKLSSSKESLPISCNNHSPGDRIVSETEEVSLRNIASLHADPYSNSRNLVVGPAESEQALLDFLPTATSIVPAIDDDTTKTLVVLTTPASARLDCFFTTLTHWKKERKPFADRVVVATVLEVGDTEDLPAKVSRAIEDVTTGFAGQETVPPHERIYAGAVAVTADTVPTSSQDGDHSPRWKALERHLHAALNEVQPRAFGVPVVINVRPTNFVDPVLERMALEEVGGLIHRFKVVPIVGQAQHQQHRSVQEPVSNITGATSDAPQVWIVDYPFQELLVSPVKFHTADALLNTVGGSRRTVSLVETHPVRRLRALASNKLLPEAEFHRALSASLAGGALLLKKRTDAWAVARSDEDSSCLVSSVRFLTDLAEFGGLGIVGAAAVAAGEAAGRGGQGPRGRGCAPKNPFSFDWRPPSS